MLRSYAAVGTIVVGPAVVAPMLAITPPLASDPELSGIRRTYAVEMKMSGPALAGRRTFTENCGACHGDEGHGTATGPALDPASSGFAGVDRRTFHMAVTDGRVREHSGVAAAGFNEIERMAKYLRELQNVDSL